MRAFARDWLSIQLKQWYLAAALREIEGYSRRRRLAILCLGAVAGMLALALLTGCGGSDSSDADSPTTETTTPASTAPEIEAGLAQNDEKKSGPVYHVRLVESEFPIYQKVGKPSLMRLSFKNFGSNPAPNLAVTFSIPGREGEAASEPFAVREGSGDVPVWELVDGYPQVADSSRRGTLSSAKEKTFTFGPLKPDQTIETRWKLRPTKAGNYTLAYEGSGDLSENSTTKSPFAGLAPSGEFAVEIKPGA